MLILLYERVTMPQILNITINNDDKNTVSKISQNLSSEFTRDTALEKNIQEQGSSQIAFRFKKGKIDASLCLISRDGGLTSTNVVPRVKSQMSIEDCNSVIIAFRNAVLDKQKIGYSLDWSDEPK